MLRTIRKHTLSHTHILTASWPTHPLSLPPVFLSLSLHRWTLNSKGRYDVFLKVQEGSVVTYAFQASELSASASAKGLRHDFSTAGATGTLAAQPLFTPLPPSRLFSPSSVLVQVEKKTLLSAAVSVQAMLRNEAGELTLLPVRGGAAWGAWGAWGRKVRRR